MEVCIYGGTIEYWDSWKYEIKNPAEIVLYYLKPFLTALEVIDEELQKTYSYKISAFQ